MDWSSFVYFPVLKTKDAELRAISCVDDLVLDKILPVYELTKSRTSKNNPVGDVSKRLDQIALIQGKRPFILDVSTDPKQMNSQIESVLVPDGGYKNWRDMLTSYAELNIVPTIHIDFDEDPGLVNALKFVSIMSVAFPRLALRLPASLEEDEYSEVIEPILDELGEAKLYVLLDEGCIRAAVKEDSLETVVELFESAKNIVLDIGEDTDWLESVVVIAGSFPQFVSKEGGGDEEGSFDIYEHGLFLALNGQDDLVKFGDYASVNINQTEMRGGTFVPRIDFCDDGVFYYYRYRRDMGSYVKCAKKVVADVRFSNDFTWGDEEIRSASAGSPSGISPSFWISVRVNNYIHRRVEVLGR